MHTNRPELTFETAMVISLGGSGENGRNCFCFQTKNGKVLLDCGVKRELDKPEEVYPELSEGLVRELDAVLLTHCHEDHSAALPLLYALGYRGKVYASQETIDATPAMIRKWMRYVRERGGMLPYDERHVQAIRFEALHRGRNEVGRFTVLAGRSGHTVGSLWYAIGWEHMGLWPLFYSGDMCLCSATLAADPPPRCMAAVLNSAYAARVLDQEAQYKALRGLAEKTVQQNGHLLLPVPAQGRGCDMLLDLTHNLGDIPIWAEESIVTNCLALLENKSWIHGGLTEARALSRVRCIRTEQERKAACDAPHGVYLTTDGMLTTSEGLYYLKRFAHQRENSLVISGHAAHGTPAALAADMDWRKENDVQMQWYRNVIKVHLDFEDVLHMCAQLGTKQIMLFHAPLEECVGLQEAIRTMNV